MNVTQEIKKLHEQIAQAQKNVEWLLEHQKVLETLPEGEFYSGGLDFDRLPHAETVKVIRALRGKWKKEPVNENKITYETTVDGLQVRCWSGEPPPSCKLVEVEEHIPEKVIPAHTVKKTKLVCSPAQAFVKLATDEGQAP